jgi:hypothetical protein
MRVSKEHSILLAFTTMSQSKLGAFNLSANGKLLWERSVDWRGAMGTMVVPLGDLALHVFYQPGEERDILMQQMTAFDIKTGAKRWFKNGLNYTIPFVFGEYRVKGQVAYFVATGQRYTRYFSLNLTDGEIFQQQIVSGGAFIGDDYVLLSGLLPRWYTSTPTVGAPMAWMVNLNTNETEWEGPALALDATEYYTVLDANEQYGVLSNTIFNASSGFSVSPNLHVINPFTGDVGRKIDLTVYWPQPYVGTFKGPRLFGSQGDVLQVELEPSGGWNGSTYYLNVSDGHLLASYATYSSPYYWVAMLTNGLVVANNTAGPSGELQYHLFVGDNQLKTISHSPLPYGNQTTLREFDYPASNLFIMSPMAVTGFQLMDGGTPQLSKALLTDYRDWTPNQVLRWGRNDDKRVMALTIGNLLALQWSP